MSHVTEDLIDRMVRAIVDEVDPETGDSLRLLRPGRREGRVLYERL